jgi:hypothetical protein
MKYKFLADFLNGILERHLWNMASSVHGLANAILQCLLFIACCISVELNSLMYLGLSKMGVVDGSGKSKPDAKRFAERKSRKHRHSHS